MSTKKINTAAHRKAGGIPVRDLELIPAYVRNLPSRVLHGEVAQIEAHVVEHNLGRPNLWDLASVRFHRRAHRDAVRVEREAGGTR